MPRPGRAPRPPRVVPRAAFSAVPISLPRMLMATGFPGRNEPTRFTVRRLLGSRRGVTPRSSTGRFGFRAQQPPPSPPPPPRRRRSRPTRHRPSRPRRPLLRSASTRTAPARRRRGRAGRRRRCGSAAERRLEQGGAQLRVGHAATSGQGDRHGAGPAGHPVGRRVRPEVPSVRRPSPVSASSLPVRACGSTAAAWPGERSPSRSRRSASEQEPLVGLHPPAHRVDRALAPAGRRHPARRPRAECRRRSRRPTARPESGVDPDASALHEGDGRGVDRSARAPRRGTRPRTRRSRWRGCGVRS